MNTLPILQRNAYLTLLIKDNHIYANLAYTDYSSQRTYILSDVTDLTPLKFRLDDSVFNKEFWYEYFDALESVFDWDIVDREWESYFKIKEFEREEVGVSGIKVVVDDNQAFFKNILLSLKEFSQDIVLRVLDDKYMEGLLKDFLTRLEYDDILWVDLDLSTFSIYRATKEEDGSKFVVSKIGWNNEIGLIDFVKSSKLQAFLSMDSSSDEISNRWANCIAHGCEYVSDPLLGDILRAFSTLQILSIKQSKEESFKSIGRKNGALFVTGKIVNMIDIRGLLFSIVDGLELEGVLDIYLDKENKLLSFGKSIIEKEEAQDIVVLKGDVLPKVIKLVIPEIPVKSKNKVIFSGKVISQDFEEKDIYALGSSLQIVKLPKTEGKIIVEGELKNGALFPHYTSNKIQFMSVKGATEYEYLVVDCRTRPIVYGPSVSENRIKFKIWSNGDKE